MTEKEVKGKETQSEEIDPLLLEQIEPMKIIDKEMPNADPSQKIAVYIEYMKKKYFNTKNNLIEKQNTNEINLESLVNALPFRTSKNGTSVYATIDPEIAQKLPREFEIKDDKFFVKKDSKTPVIIKVKKKTPQ